MDDSDGEETDDDFPSVGPIPKRVKSIFLGDDDFLIPVFKGWTCDKKEIQRTTDCPNQDIIDKVNLIKLQIWHAHTFWFQLTELMGLHKSKMGDDDHWRAFSYSKCIYICSIPYLYHQAELSSSSY